MKTLIFKTLISASKQKVWDTMIEPETYAAWTGEVWPASYYVGEWKTGENLSFIGASGSGTLATLLDCNPYDHILAKHIAVLLPGGAEDRESEMACGWINSLEEYTFGEKDGATELTVSMTVGPDWETMFNHDWPKAMAKLKAVCEA